MTAPKPLRSLYGYGERPQTVMTPQAIVDALEQFWPDGIDLDPCACAGQLVQARVEYRHDQGKDGLIGTWLGRVYVNPPYADLQDWLAQARACVLVGTEIVMLVPVRTHRAWWRGAARSANSVLWLDPVKFHGYDQAFPAPLALLYWGSRSMAFVDAFGHLGGAL